MSSDEWIATPQDINHAAQTQSLFVLATQWDFDLDFWIVIIVLYNDQHTTTIDQEYHIIA